MNDTLSPGISPDSPATGAIRHCRRCGIAYDWRRNISSSLKMTYCNSLCEAADLGFTIDAMLHAPAHGTPGTQRALPSSERPLTIHGA